MNNRFVAISRGQAGELSIRYDLIALAALAALGITACGGGGGVGSPGLPQGQPTSSSSKTSQSVTRTYTLASAAGSYDLPPLGGFSGSLALPAASVPANTRLELTSSLTAPAGAPNLQGQDALRRPKATWMLNVYSYTTILLSSTVTFPTLPGFSVTLPATVNPTGLQFFYAISNPKPTNGADVQFRTEGPATVSGQIVTFAPSSAALTLQAGQPYTIAFYAISAIAMPMPPPASGKIYVANYNNTVTTYNADGSRTSPTITAGLNQPSAVTVNAAGKIYVTNYPSLNGGNTVTTYNANGTPTTPTITAGVFMPTGVAVDAAGKIYVADDGFLTVTTYNADGTQTTPTITAGLNGPLGVAVDAAGKIYVTNIGNGTVTTYNADGTQTTPTITDSNETGVAVDASGKIYLTNFGTNTVTTYNADGTRTTPTITAGLNEPSAVAVNAAGKIFVANYGNSTVTTYNADGTQTTPTISAGVSEPNGVAVH
jgi:hypothetical protein